MTLSETSYRKIPLTKGQVAIVDSDDYEMLTKRSWYAFWNPNKKAFYAVRQVRVGPRKENKRILVFMHRQILGLSPKDGRQGDHRNGNTLDNRRENLRHATQSQNARNRKVRYDSTSGLKGAWFQKSHKKWASQICVDRKKIFLGLFDSAEDAHQAYCQAAALYHGEFARFN